MKNVNLQRCDEQAYIHVSGGETIGVSSGFTALTGYSGENTLGREISDVFKSLLKLDSASYETLCTEGNKAGYIFTSSLEPREVEIERYPLDRGDLEFVLSEKPDSRLDDRLSVLSAMFEDDLMSVAVYSVPELVVLKSNKRYQEFLSLCKPGPCQAAGISILECSDLCPQLPEVLNTILSTGKITHFDERKIICPNGFETYRTYTLQPIFVGDKFKYILEVSKDVTRGVRTVQRQQVQENELKQYWQEMNEKNIMLSRQAKLLDLSNEAIFAWKLDGPIVYWNKGAERMYGFDSAEAVGCTNIGLLKTEFPDKTPNIQDLLRVDGEWQGMLEHITKDGRRLFVESRIQLITDEFGMQLALETNRDVTERKKMEDEIRERELYFRIASEASGAGVYTYDHKKKKGYYSAQYKAILGLAADDPVNADDDFAFTHVHPEDRENLIKAIWAANDPTGDGIYDHEYRIIRTDKAVRWIHARGQTYYKQDGDTISHDLAAGVIVDITEGKLLLDKIRQISEELTNIIESTDDYIWAVGTDGRVRFCNSAAKEFFKKYYGTEIVVNQLITDLVPPYIVKSFTDKISQPLLEGSMQFDLRTPIGGKITSYSLNPVYIDKEFIEVTIFAKDVTARRNAEREMLRANALLEERVAERTAQLQQSVSDLKNITLVMSHDLKSALRGISMYATDITEQKDIDENARRIKKLGGGILSMIDGLMKFERSSRLSLTREDVNIKKLTAAVFNELNSNEAATKGFLEFETGLPAVKVDKELFRHVIMNILSNALKFTKPGVAPRIVVGCREENHAYIFYFRDNGIGIDMSYADKIFDVFERLHSKNEFEGSGVGLAIVRNIILRHGGRVWVESEEGIGTTVYFSLPVQTEGDDHV